VRILLSGLGIKLKTFGIWNGAEFHPKFLPENEISVIMVNRCTVGGMGSGSSFMSRTPEEFLSNVSEMEAQEGSTYTHLSVCLSVVHGPLYTPVFNYCLTSVEQHHAAT